MAQLKDLYVMGSSNLIGSVILNGQLNLKPAAADNSALGPNGISWDSSSLPNDTNPQYVCTIKAFADGGRQMWTSVSTLKNAMGISAYTGSVS